MISETINKLNMNKQALAIKSTYNKYEKIGNEDKEVQTLLKMNALIKNKYENICPSLAEQIAFEFVSQ